MKLLFIMIQIILLNKCFLHHANVRDDYYGVKSIIPFTGSGFTSSLPVRVEFDPREKSQIPKYLKDKGINIDIDPNIVDSWYSEEIISKFRNSRYFINSVDANVKIRISSTIEEVKAPVITLIAQICTFGIVPALTRTNGRIEFELYDSSSQTVLKNYKYPVEHRYFLGIPPLFLAPVLGLFSERFDHSMNQRTFAIMRVAFQQFEDDLLYDVSNSKNLYSKFTIDKTKATAFLQFPPKSRSEDRILSDIHSAIENGFIGRGMVLVERKKMNLILNEIRLSQLGITDSSRIQIGRLTSAGRIIYASESNVQMEGNKLERISFTLKCIDVNSGSIIWTQIINHSFKDSRSINYEIDDIAYQIMSSLKRQGNL